MLRLVTSKMKLKLGNPPALVDFQRIETEVPFTLIISGAEGLSGLEPVRTSRQSDHSPSPALEIPKIL